MMSDVYDDDDNGLPLGETCQCSDTAVIKPTSQRLDHLDVTALITTGCRNQRGINTGCRGIINSMTTGCLLTRAAHTTLFV